MSEAARAKINDLLTFGIVTSNPKNVVWDSNHKKFAFQDEYGNRWSVDFTQVNGLPVSATIHNGNTGTAVGVVTYRYDPNFFGGRLPSEFTRYAGNVASDGTEIEVVRIKSLKISKQHLPLAELDPDKLFTSTNSNYMPLFYSNNIAYWTDAKGKVRQVMQPKQMQ
jgi:hypothetical protein